MSTVAVNGSLDRAAAFYGSSIGKKMVMAITGFILFGFVLVHMVANLQVFLPAGPDGIHAIDRYAEHLRVFPPLLWTARMVLLASLILHIVAAWQVSVLNKFGARTSRYVKQTAIASSYASRTMVWSGPIVFFYVIYHLLQFTFGTVQPGFEPGHVYHNVILGFQNPVIAIFYIIANILLAMHLYHGVWSMFQSLGISHPRYTPILKKASVVFGVVIGIGFCSVPLAVMTGILK